MKPSLIPGFTLARTRQTVEDGLRKSARPSEMFRKLTGKNARKITAPAERGHNSLMWHVEAEAGEQMKLYCFDHGQSAGQMATLLGLLNENGLRVPRILEFDETGGWIVAEWIKGCPLSPADALNPEIVSEVAAFEAKQNNIWISRKVFRRSFSYFHHLVLDRYLYWTEKRFGPAVAALNEQLVLELTRRWPAVPETAKPAITNPDFSFENLVRDDKGELAVIDTEFLTADSSAAFELANFLERTRRVGDGFDERYLSLYGQRAPTDIYLDEKAFWDACVELKLVGKQAMYWRASDADLLRRIQTIGEVICAN